MTGASSFFGPSQSKSLLNGSRKMPPPVVSELLMESLKGDEGLLAECKDRDKSILNGEIIIWNSFNLPMKTAITCLRWCKVRGAQLFFLALATKSGNILTYKVRMSEEDKLLEEREARRSYSDPTYVSNSSEDDFLWLQPPSSPVEMWKQLLGHQKVSVWKYVSLFVQAVTSLYSSNEGRELVSTSIDTTLRFWDLSRGYLTKIFSDSVPVLMADFLPTEPRLFVTSNTRSLLRVVDSIDGRVQQRMKVDSEIRAVCFDTCGLNLIAGTRDGVVESYDIGEDRLVNFSQKLLTLTSVRFGIKMD